jgi:hypothetical protein
MRPERTSWRRRVVSALALAAGLASSGCVPGAAWLPDSSGLIYTGGKNYDRLIHYDLAKGEQKILVADTGAPTFWPAVSPDGKRIAVAKAEAAGKDKPVTVQVILYSLDGKEQKRSKLFTLVEKAEGLPEKDRPLATQLYWSPRGDRVVVHLFGMTGIFDVTADRFTSLGEAVLLGFGGTPFRPDGSGFLVMKNVRGWLGERGEKGEGQDRTPRFSLVDLDGKERAIKPPPLLTDEEALKKEKDINKLVALLCPVLYQSGWEDDVAHVSWNVDRLRYFTKKGEAVIDSVKPQKADDGKLVQISHRLAGGTVVRVVALESKLDKQGNTSPVRVEVIRPGGKDAQVIFAKADGCVPTLSPNGKLVALRCITNTKKHDQQQESILVVNEKGELAANLHVPR